MSTFLVGKMTASWAEAFGLKTVYVAETESTNSLAKSSEPGVGLILSEYQTKGRGRNQNSWQIKAGDGLLSTWVFSLTQTPSPILSPLIGLAVFNALNSTWTHLPLGLKAPNDIYVADKKVAGLLIENISQGSSNRLIIGLGLNVFSAPENMPATALASASSVSKTTWHQFLDRLFLEISFVVENQNAELSELQQKNLLEALNQYSGLSEKFLEISPAGSLKTAIKTISWMEL